MKYICKGTIKENGKQYKAGEEYKGKNVKELRTAGALITEKELQAKNMAASKLPSEKEEGLVKEIEALNTKVESLNKENSDMGTAYKKALDENAELKGRIETLAAEIKELKK